MKNFFYYFLVLFLTISCSLDVDVILPPYYYYTPGTNTEGVITFGNYSQSTRAVADATLGYDCFKVYGWTKDSVVLDGYDVMYQNENWVYQNINNQPLHWFDTFVDKYEFIGVIPNNVQQSFDNGTLSVTGVESFLIDNPYEGIQGVGNDTPKEFLYAYTTVTDYQSIVPLHFLHGNSKVYLRFTSDDANTEIIDYSPYTPYLPAIVGIKTEKSGGAFNLMSDGYFVGYPYDSNLESSETGAHGFTYVGVDNGTYTAATWLLSMKDAVNSQFTFVDENGNDVSNVDWVVKGDRKNKVFIKFANAETQANVISGNDAFKSGVEAVNNSGFTNNMLNSNNFKYSNGWRAVRISEVSAGKVCVWYMANTNMTVQTITGGSPEVPESGIEGIVILPAKVSTTPNRVVDLYVTKADAAITSNGCVFTPTNYALKIKLTKPSGKISTTPVASPTVLFALPCNDSEVGFTVKFSFNYKGVSIYDARVWIPAEDTQWQLGKYYLYTINIKGRGNGKPEPNDINGEDPTIENAQMNPEITLNVNIIDYLPGGNYNYNF